jgi:hypothetical protein
MVNLRPTGNVAKWFVWCCDHLPATVAMDYGAKPVVSRKGMYYVENGTNLCHIFWAILWVPLLIVAVASFVLFMVVIAHVALYREHSDQMGIVAAFIPEEFVLASALLGGILILAILGASKIGFFKLLWLYLTSLKGRICPLVKFQINDVAPGD